MRCRVLICVRRLRVRFRGCMGAGMDGQDGFWIKSRMTVWGSAGTRCGVALPPLWIADQVRNDGMGVTSRPTLWILP